MNRLYLPGLLLLTVGAVAALSRGASIWPDPVAWSMRVALAGLMAFLWAAWALAERRRRS